MMLTFLVSACGERFLSADVERGPDRVVGAPLREVR